MRKMLFENNLFSISSRSISDPSLFSDSLFSDLLEWGEVAIGDYSLSECAGIIIQNAEDAHFGVESLSRKLGMSHSSLYKKIRAVFGCSANEFIRFIRLRYASQMLIHSPYNINEVAFNAGFNDVKYFRQQFKNLYKLTPSAYKRRYGASARVVFRSREQFSFAWNETGHARSVREPIYPL